MQVEAGLRDLLDRLRTVDMRGGTLSTISPGMPDQILALRSGDFSVQYPGFTRALTNSGTEAIELVEMELK